ncbi:AraC family transcriptional regulator [Kosakonia sp. MUSA4]|uniref:AraC family transcriptional regulator n=1 Tax=Kosakonia sp. MUSA4 TaxID=2067958 RepID=UPI0020975B84|nr:AraC family transcriptional regulator [Kosakonia sp. MUSA4]
MGGQEFTYDPAHYLVVSAPLPFTSQTTASQQEPLLAMSVSLDVATIAELLIEMGEGDGRGNEKAGILFSTPLGEELADTVYRLLVALSDEEKSRILGSGIHRYNAKTVSDFHQAASGAFFNGEAQCYCQ